MAVGGFPDCVMTSDAGDDHQRQQARPHAILAVKMDSTGLLTPAVDLSVPGCHVCSGELTSVTVGSFDVIAVGWDFWPLKPALCMPGQTIKFCILYSSVR